MPTYEFECQTCGNRHTVVAKMSEYDGLSKVCQMQYDAIGQIANCGGDLVQVYDNRESNFILQGSGWTPKFGPTNAVDTRFKRR